MLNQKWAWGHSKMLCIVMLHLQLNKEDHHDQNRTEFDVNAVKEMMTKECHKGEKMQYLNGGHIQTFISPGKHLCKRIRQLFCVCALNVYKTHVSPEFSRESVLHILLSWSFLRFQNQTMPMCKPWYKTGANVQAACGKGLQRVRANRFALDSLPLPLNARSTWFTI